MKDIALFGGSFDPPHVAHEQIVKELLKLDFIDKVVVMPTYLNPFKSGFHADANMRLKWLRKIFKKYKNVSVDEFEVKQNKAMPSIRSVEYLLKKYNKIYLVIGADNLKNLHKWQEYEKLKQLVEFIVINRGKIDIPKNFISVDMDINISSTSLRESMDISKLPQVCAKEIYKEYKCKKELKK